MGHEADDLLSNSTRCAKKTFSSTAIRMIATCTPWGTRQLSGQLLRWDPKAHTSR